MERRHTERGIRVLRHIGDPPGDLARRQRGEIRAVHTHRSRRGAQQLCDALDERRLARPVGAEQAEHLARGNAERHIVENPPLRPIAKGEMLCRETHCFTHVSDLPLRRIRWMKSGTPRKEMTMPTGIVTG